jgi:3-(methylthio)propanoyl-CoA dehydrogenase
MLAHHDDNPREAAAGALPYLRLTGTVVGGWQFARAAQIASQQLADGSENASYLRAKIATARFYADHVLPETGSYGDEVMKGAASTLALDEAAF